MPLPETYTKCNRESAYDVPGPYWCIRLTTRAWKNRLYRLPSKKRLARLYCTQYLSLRIRTTNVSRLEKKNKEKTRR